LKKKQAKNYVKLLTPIEWLRNNNWNKKISSFFFAFLQYLKININPEKRTFRWIAAKKNKHFEYISMHLNVKMLKIFLVWPQIYFYCLNSNLFKTSLELYFDMEMKQLEAIWADRCQFHQHFTCEFFLRMLFWQLFPRTCN